MLIARHLDAEARLPAEMRQQALLTQVRDFIDRHLGMSPRAYREVRRTGACPGPAE
ncbi:hypothetical protein ACFY2R_09295 [Micromonospora olivasterospora]|uniref:Uncharacterized protein n=1 Tax=Micromonospora olivasterospora TaxID=1880 RepID=A0A562IEZ2_MICOL|nr:hypothetical protein [Micromonospora olivasterospora]TWH69398.1 hypothetical protein JD77_04407 [Micromonospora olivasterospora]